MMTVKNFKGTNYHGKSSTFEQVISKGSFKCQFETQLKG